VTDAVRLSLSVVRELKKFDPQARRRIQAVIELLVEEPRPAAVARLVGGAGEWRVRRGNYRIIYEIHDDELIVLVLRMGHRREVYRAN
jgi:mRNA interferase RelE/StbE